MQKTLECTRIRGRHLDIPIPMCTALSALYSTARYSFFPIFRKEKFEYRTLFAVFLLGIQRVRQQYIFGEFYSRTTLLVLVRLISNRRGTLASCLSSLPGKNTDFILKINNFTTILVQKSLFGAKFLINCNAHC